VTNELDKLLTAVIAIAKTAGDAIMPLHQSDQLEIINKADGTPQTQADLLAHQIIVSGLSALNDDPILSEEGEIPGFDVRQQWTRFWISDPLDGTRGFIQGLDEFTVNIALMERQRPVLGVIYAPVFQTLYFACRGAGAFKQKEGAAAESISVVKPSKGALRFIAGKFHKQSRIQHLLDKIPGATLIQLNSSLKFVWIADGKVDAYVRFGPISEWDTAAGDCILEEAGGKVVDFNGQSLQYNAGESLRCPPFLAAGDSECIAQILQELEQMTEEE